MSRMQVAQQAAVEHPYTPTSETPTPELTERGINISPYARGERQPRTGIFRFEKPKPSVPRGTVAEKDVPGALQKVTKAAKEQWDITADDVKSVIARGDVRREIPALLDGADNAARQVAYNARQAIELSSTDKLPTGLTGRARDRAAKENQAEALERRKAAIPYIAAGKTDNAGNWTANKSKILDWRAKLDIAEAKARSWTQDINPLKRREGRRWLDAVKQMQAGVDYAEAHWSDRTFVEGAQQYRKEIHDAITFENLHGATTVERDNYIPGLFSGVYFAGKRLLGTRYRMPKKFQNPYDAIAAGPYYLANQDVAVLADSRILAGRRAVERSLWTETLQGMKDPVSGKPIAKQPVMVMRNVVDPATGETSQEPAWQMPSTDYEPVYSRTGAKPIAVYNPYARLVKKLIRPSIIEDLPLGKEALATTGILKHGVILLFDTFHPARLSQYMAALTGPQGFGFRGGSSALTYRPEDLPRAVERGYISAEAAKWATDTIDVYVPTTRTTATGRTTTIGTTPMTRKAIADQLIRHGLNAAKITDALYKDAVQNIPFLGEAYHKAISPYNRLLFDKFLPGLMVEAAVRNFERYNKSNPGTPLPKIARDVIRDINTDFGNLGRQGIFKSATFRDIAQLIFLAPMWQEGLLRKELSFYGRAAALPLRLGAAAMGKELPYRKGLPPMGATGRMMATGLGTYFVLTQLINLVTRKQLTFQNTEEDHKWDAFLPIGDKGVWISPMSVFAETTHDFVRLGETKPQVMDRIVKMGENRLGPIGKMANILWKGESPTGERFTSSGERVRSGLAQVTPFAGAAPITFGVPGRAIGHAIAPGLVGPNPPGAVPRQLLASLGGLKTEAGKSAMTEAHNLATAFIEREGLKKDTGWQQVMTDDPSYTRMRRQLRNNDLAGAAKTLNELKKNRSDRDVIKAMRMWAKRPLTGSNKNEKLFIASLSDKELDIYTSANEERMQLLQQFLEWMNSQP